MLDLDYLTNRIDFGKAFTTFDNWNDLKEYINKAYRFSPIKFIFLVKYQSNIFNENLPLWPFIKKLKYIDELLEQSLNR